MRRGTGIAERLRLIVVVVEFILRFVQRVLLTLDLFFRSFLLMLSLLLEGVLFLVRQSTGCCRSGIGLLVRSRGTLVTAVVAVAARRTTTRDATRRSPEPVYWIES